MQKGQIFSLDFLISLVAVMAAIGLMVQAIEVNTYYQKEERQFNELKTVAETAGDMLVGNPEIVCELVDGSGGYLGSVGNCIPWVNNLRITKSGLGIPDGFKCRLEQLIGGQVLQPNSYECKDDLGTAENMTSVVRQVVIFKRGPPSHQITKAELEDCLKQRGSCRMTDEKIMLKVWKA